MKGRLKVTGIAVGCVLLGWIATTMLGSSEIPNVEQFDTAIYDINSAGVLTDPSGFGLPQYEQGLEGVIGNNPELETIGNRDGEVGTPERLSVTRALSGLRQAVSDKLRSWSLQQARPQHQGNRVKKTELPTGKKPPNAAISTSLAGEHIKDGIKEEERLGARTRIGKCTILFNSNDYWERAIKTHENHDKLHGYRLHVLRQHLLDDVWSKPAYVLSLLLREMSKPEGERLEWLLWVDADTIVLNPYVPIETFLPPPGGEFEDVHLMYSNDWNGLNNGVFLLRVNQWSVQLFSAIVAYRHYKPEDVLIFRDQSAMNTLMQAPKFAKNVVQAPQRWFNAYQGEHNETLMPFQARRGDLLVHFAGVPEREKRMGYWLERAEQHLDDWEIPVKSTSYPQEARDFWSQQQDARQDRRTSVTGIRLQAIQLLTKTDRRLSEYGDRLSDDQKTVIGVHEAGVRKILEGDRWEDEIDQLSKLTRKLDDATQPLVTAIAEANKKLLSAAHEAIFAGEKDLLDGDFRNGIESTELQKISEAMKSLKNLVMSPEEMWDKQDLITATNAVTEARASLQEKAASDAQAKLEEDERTKALEEAKKQAQVGSYAAAGIQAPTVKVEASEISTTVPVEMVTGHMVTITPEVVIVWTTTPIGEGKVAEPTATGSVSSK